MISKFFALLFFIAFVLGQFGRIQFQNGISVTMIDSVVVLALMYGIVRLYQGKTINKILTVPLFRLLGFFTFCCLLSLFLSGVTMRSDELFVAVLYLLRFILYGSLFVVLNNMTKNERHFIVWGVALGVLTAVCIGFVQFVYYPSLGNLFYLGWDDHLYRLFSVYLDPNFSAVLFSLLFLLLLHLLLRKPTKRVKIVFTLMLALTALAIFLTYSRTGMISLIVGTSVLLLLKGYGKLLLFFIGIFVLLLVVTSNVKIEGLNPFRTASSSARLESMRIAIAIFQKSPLTGVGFNAYRYAQHEYGFRPDGAWETSHADSSTDNSFLFVLATTGIIGLIAYVLVWLQIIRDLTESMRKKKYFAEVGLATIAAVLVSSLFLNTLFYPFILVWIVVVYSLRDYTSL